MVVFLHKEPLMPQFLVEVSHTLSFTQRVAVDAASAEEAGARALRVAEAENTELFAYDWDSASDAEASLGAIVPLRGRARREPDITREDDPDPDAGARLPPRHYLHSEGHPPVALTARTLGEAAIEALAIFGASIQADGEEDEDEPETDAQAVPA
jgi:hypothetical protein